MNANSTLDESAKAAARYHVELTARQKATEEASEIRASWEDELHRLEKRRTRCNVLGAICACVAAVACYLIFNAMLADINPSGTLLILYQVLIVSMSIFVIFWYFTWPFGFCPLIDFMKNNGFWVIAGWVVMLCLFMVVLMFTLFAGPIYFFYLQFKIKKTKRTVEAVKRNEQAVYAEYENY